METTVSSVFDSSQVKLRRITPVRIRIYHAFGPSSICREAFSNNSCRQLKDSRLSSAMQATDYS